MIDIGRIPRLNGTIWLSRYQKVFWLKTNIQDEAELFRGLVERSL